MSSALAFFLFYFHCFSLQFPQPNPLQNLPCSGWPAALQPRGEGLSTAVSRSRPPSSVAGAAARRRIALFEPGAPSEAEALGELGCSGGRCRCGLPATRLVSWTLEPFVGRPWWRLSDCPFPSATFTRAAIQLADREQSSRCRQHWRR